MKRALVLICMFLLSFQLFCDPIEFEYEPYEEDEFPLWSYEIRRAESIFFGSFVITLPVSMLCYNLAGSFGAPVASSASTRMLHSAAIASGLSLAIAGIDYLIGALSD